MHRTAVELKAANGLINEERKGNPSRSLKDDPHKYGSIGEVISVKYAAMREQSKQSSFNPKPVEPNITSAKVSLIDARNSDSNPAGSPSSGLALKWESLEFGLQNFKANLVAKKFLPLRQTQENEIGYRAPPSQSLDDIFQRLKRPSADHVAYNDEDGDE